MRLAGAYLTLAAVKARQWRQLKGQSDTGGCRGGRQLCAAMKTEKGGLHTGGKEGSDGGWDETARHGTAANGFSRTFQYLFKAGLSIAF